MIFSTKEYAVVFECVYVNRGLWNIQLFLKEKKINIRVPKQQYITQLQLRTT